MVNAIGWVAILAAGYIGYLGVSVWWLSGPVLLFVLASMMLPGKISGQGHVEYLKARPGLWFRNIMQYVLLGGVFSGVCYGIGVGLAALT